MYSFLTVEGGDEYEEMIEHFALMNKIDYNRDMAEISPGIWVFDDERTEFDFPELFTEIMLLRINGANGLTYNELGRILRNYKKSQFFYDYQPLKKVNDKKIHELRDNGYISDEKEFERIRDTWISLNWIHENEVFDRLVFDLKKSRLKASKLYHLLLSLETVWNDSYGTLSGGAVSLPETFGSWQEVEKWLIAVYEKRELIVAGSDYSKEVIDCIMHEIENWKEEYAAVIERHLH